MREEIEVAVFAFFGPITPQDLDRNVKAVFGELNVPILENLSAQVADLLRLMLAKR